tara:strand:+ start:435 stop:617 length:183 start_codon:yes stop_codon:yes gene_type:complete
MPKALTSKQQEARYAALSEAAEHLRMDWATNSDEAEQGLEMAKWLDAQALKWLSKSMDAD